MWESSFPWTNGWLCSLEARGSWLWLPHTWMTYWNHCAALGFVPVTPELMCLPACGCLRAHLCPSWQSKSPREAYLTWFTRWRKQINKIALHNALLLFPPHCIPSVMAMFETQQERDKRNILPIDDECPDCFWYILPKLLYFRLKCGRKIGGGKCSCVRKKPWETLFRVQFVSYIKNLAMTLISACS